MEQYTCNPEDFSSSSINNRSSESDGDRQTSSDSRKYESNVVNEEKDSNDTSGPSGPFDTLPDLQDKNEVIQETFGSCEKNEDQKERNEDQKEPQVSEESPRLLREGYDMDTIDADVVSLIDIETSLDNIQSNGCNAGENEPVGSTEPLQMRNNDGEDFTKNVLSQKSDAGGSETAESSSIVVSSCESNESESTHISSPSENQMECEISQPSLELSSDEKDKVGVSDYAIMPGELMNQLIEGPSITLPPSELQNHCITDPNGRAESEAIPPKEVPSVNHSESTAQPDSNVISITNSPGSNDNVRSQGSVKTEDTVLKPNDTSQTVQENSETKTNVSEDSSLHSSTKTAQTPSNAPIKQRIKKTPHDFIFGKVLGEGSYSTVHLAKEVSSQKEFAIKVCDKKHLIREGKAHFVMREKEVLMKLDHPFFIRLAYTFQDPDRLYYVLTYARNGELLTYLHKLSVFDIPCTRFYSAELVLALDYLQSIGIVHRDLKPENILFGDEMHIKITDFGTSKIMASKTKDASGKDKNRKNSFVGTAEYVSPEVLNNLPANYGSDIWALGCIIYQCLSSSPPFRCGNEYQTFQKIVKLDYEFPDGFNEEAKDLIQQLLVIEPNDRLGMCQPEGMSKLKSHHFFTGIDWENLPTSTPPKLLPYLPANRDNPEFWGGQELRTGFDDQRLAEIITGQSIDGTQSPEVELVPVKGLNQMEEAERKEKFSKQRLDNPFHPFVEDNLILRQGFVDKRKGLFARKRMLLLTEGPHLYYVDAHNRVLKGEIPWSKDLRPEAKNFKIFFVHTPNRTYYLESRQPDAHLWVKAIQDVWKKYYEGGRD